MWLGKGCRGQVVRIGCLSGSVGGFPGPVGGPPGDWDLLVSARVAQGVPMAWLGRGEFLRTRSWGRGGAVAWGVLYCGAESLGPVFAHAEHGGSFSVYWRASATSVCS